MSFGYAQPEVTESDSIRPLPFKFDKVFRKYIVVPDTLLDAKKDSTRTIKFVSPEQDERFSKLNRSGIIYRGFTIGTDKDFKINSGLNLTLSGEIYDNLELNAVLSDQDMPVTQDGYTESLTDIENIYIELSHPNFYSRMGDFDLEYTDRGVFGNFERKLKGIYLKGIYEKNNADVSLSVSEGKRTTYEFRGKDGKQGPYELTAGSSDYITVVAGSEKIYLNGQLLKRGSNNDYVIDYSTAEVIFTVKRAIDSDDNIVADFEYTDENYKKNIYSFSTETHFFNDKLQMSTSYVTDRDDYNNPVSFEATDENIDIIKKAGTNPDSSIVDGATKVDVGDGLYVKREIIEGSNVYYYEYVGRDSIGDYNVRFSKFKNGGKYKRYFDNDGTVYFDTVSVGGEYLPYIKLPLPERLDVYNTRVKYEDKNIYAEGELALSDYRRNVLYETDGIDISGVGDREVFRYTTNDLKYDKTEIGRFRFSGERMYTGKDLKLFGRKRRPDFSDDIGVFMPDTTEIAEYNIGVGYNFRSLFEAGATYGKVDANDVLNSQKYGGYIKGSNKYLHYFESSAEKRETDTETDEKFTRDKYDALITYKLSRFFLTPSYSYEKEEREEFLTFKGEKDNIYSFNLLYRHSNDFEIEDEISYNKRDSYLDDEYRHYLDSYINNLDVSYNYGTVLRNNFLWIKKMDYFQYGDSANTSYDLARLRSDYNYKSRYYGSLEYELTKTEEVKKARIFYETEEGEGEFSYDPVEDEYYPDEDGDYNYFTINSGTSIPVTGVKFNLEMFFDLEEKNVNDDITYWLSRFDFDTKIKIEEKSRAKNINDIIFLNFTTFQEDSTVSGTLEFSERIYFLAQNRPLSFEYYYNYSDRFSNTYLSAFDNKLTKSRRHELTVKNTFGKLSFRTSGGYETDKISNLTSTVTSNDIISRIFKEKITYMFDYGSRVSFETKYLHENDHKSNVTIDMVELSPSGTYAYSSNGNVRVGFTYVKVISDSDAISYHLAEGYKKGDSYKWSTNFLYYISDSMTASVNYLGDYLPENEKTTHEMSAELRLNF